MKRFGNGEGKPRLSLLLVGRETLEGESRVWEAGAKKYGEGNWLNGGPWMEGLDSLTRHVVAFVNGEDIDPESGRPHVDHIITSAKIVSNNYYNSKDLDDRPCRLEKNQ